jgi:DNA-binding NtrC family response regulator
MLTDVVLPGMNGWKLFKEIHKKRPEMKVIFTSGFIDNPVVQNNIFKNKMPFIKKPFEPDYLISTLRKVLDE